MERALVSVVVPVYNVEAYLEECLDSIVNQKLENIEILCIDDGSTDASSDIIDRYAKQDGRIRTVHKPNSGYGHTVNTGLELAKGKYISIVESDDYIPSDMLEELFETAEKNEADIVKGDFYTFTGNTDRKFKHVPLYDNENYYGKILNPSLDINCFAIGLFTWAGLYNRAFIERNHIRHNETPGASYQDNGFWFQTFVLAQKVYLVKKPYYRLRRDNPCSSIHSREKVYCICEEYDFIKNFLVKDRKRYERFCAVHNYYRFKNYYSTINRIDDRYRLDFIRRFAEDFKREEEERGLDENVFRKEEWDVLRKIMENPNDYYSYKFWELDYNSFVALHNWTRVIIYGAGKVGNAVQKIVKKNQVEIVAVAVSSEENNPSRIDDIEVRRIETLKKYREECLTIISVSSQYYNEVLEKLKKYGFKHIACFNVSRRSLEFIN